VCYDRAYEKARKQLWRAKQKKLQTAKIMYEEKMVKVRTECYAMGNHRSWIAGTHKIENNNSVSFQINEALSLCDIFTMFGRELDSMSTQDKLSSLLTQIQSPRWWSHYGEEIRHRRKGSLSSNQQGN
jgi:hypothetical protein